MSQLRPNVRRRLPRAPTRVVPSVGPLAAVKDPATRRLIELLQSRLSTQDQQLQDLRTFALKVGSPIDAYLQRIKQVGEAVARDDAVPLWQVQKLINELTAYTQRRAVQQADEGDGLGPIGAGSDPPTVALPNLYDSVAEYAATNPADLANSCIGAGGTWAFMTGLIAFLQGIDERVGGNGKRGDVSDPSQDAIAYYHGILPPVAGSNNVYVVDVISGHCGLAPGPSWNDVTTSRAAGAWLSTVP